MIDIHSHILPELDDGSNSLEQSVEMLRIAARSGTTAMVASPHANPEFNFDPAVVERKIAELQAAAGDAVRVYYGCDFHLQYDNITDALRNPRKYTVNHKCYLLVEFSDLAIFQTTNEVFRSLLAAGMVPIITHPERNSLLRQRLNDLRRWVQEGVLLQVTSESFFGHWGKKARSFTELLMEQGLVHVVASDAHDTEHRRPSLKEARQYVSRRFSEDLAVRLFEANPRAIVNGEPVDANDPALRVKKRRWYSIG
jgi:protein-tyrosine phosphatase